MRELIKRRSEFLADIRCFFAGRDVLEVDTPVLCGYSATDPGLDSFRVLSHFEKGERYLLTSPEHAMKRLLAAGSGPIYQLSKAFRDGEFGRHHSPEFQMLEWYRPAYSLDDLLQELLALLACLGLPCEPERFTYRELFQRHAGLDPFTVSESALAKACREHVDFSGALPDRDGQLDLLMTHVIEPALAKYPSALVCDFPASQAALAVVRQGADGHALASRFELYIQGLEVANAYEELANSEELASRFQQDNRVRLSQGKAPIPEDARLLAVLPAMPACSGIAVGVDRLFMLKEGQKSLADILPFAWDSV